MKQHVKRFAAMVLLGVTLEAMAGLPEAAPRNSPVQAGPCEPAEPLCLAQPAGSAAGQQVISRLQQALAERDYYQGLVDGVAGEQTALAIFLFQMDCELPLTGSVNARILQVLNIPSPAWLTE
ncbi:peptidoglycan-binding protein [Pseudomonas sp. L5B5]|uniref:peptidoglycan-binding domain-containing protein n=1 Tax=Pseudomonas sp. L5B5 TaxID=2883205 RepID=UPI001CFB900F|nr:peptidoglycan-binding domain-containing protein [Pseudomonas sp. L5B5]UCZ85103.1 peptidoglycan-binding protein [Pseudomonas sp. L5B5]